MKKSISIVLAVLTLSCALCVGAGAAKSSSTGAFNPFPGIADLTKEAMPGSFYAKVAEAYRQGKLTEAEALQIITAVNTNGFLNLLSSSSKPVTSTLPIELKRALHRADVVKFPLWERSKFWNAFFKYLLFGWIWM
ncbi:MAG: hypothetical protein LBG83_08130 [Oscillospiraceae bacterium]|jgi:hypothetical protein|nr:hypothetical protein [Oscillospiraceae bacterium]